jgi:DNA invertase Pin-like site-specific DNA recombinase
MKVICYLRVSTQEQASSGLGLAAQRARLEQELAIRGWSDAEWIEDAGFSAASLNRPGIKRALELLTSGNASVLMVAKLDRLSRSLLDFAALMDRARREAWQVIALDLGVDTSTPAGEMMASVVASFAQYERRLISQRTRDGLAAAAAKGTKVGRPTAVPADVRQFITKARGEGYSLASIADTLTKKQIPTAHGGIKWYPSTIKAILAA